MLISFSAGAFYGFKTIIVPHNLPTETLSAHLQHVQADALIAEVGSLDVSLVTKENRQLSLVLWVAKYGNRHMDWHEVPEGAKGNLDVSVWHELVEEQKDLTSMTLPEYDPSTPTPGLNTVWPSASQAGEFIDFQSDVRKEVPLLMLKSDNLLEPRVCNCRLELCTAARSAFLLV
jgi:hypothetical protein